MSSSEPSRVSGGLHLVSSSSLPPDLLQQSVGAWVESTFPEKFPQLLGGIASNEEALVCMCTGELDDASSPSQTVAASYPVAFAVLRYFPAEVDLAFLRMLVVDPSRRCQGVGTRMWPLLLKHVAQRGKHFLIFNIFRDEMALAMATAADNQRRLKFYERVGAKVLDVKGYCCVIAGVEHPMLLMAADVEGQPLPSDPAWAETQRDQVDIHRSASENWIRCTGEWGVR
jgi:ribosomal protein S18 acetylase RimI-like enzyme